MHCYAELILRYVEEFSNWTIEICRVSPKALLPVCVSLISSGQSDPIIYCLVVLDIILCHSFGDDPVVVVGNCLLGSTSNGIMVLHDADYVEHIPVGLSNCFNCCRVSILIEHLLSIKLCRCMIIIGSSSNILFLIWSRRIIASPVSIRVVRIWEQIIIFGRPSDIMTSNCIDVITGSRVSEEVLITMVFVHVLDHVVKTLVVLEGIHISEVVSKQYKYIIGKVM